MSSKSTEKKPQIISVSSVEEPLKLKNAIVPFSKFGHSIQYIYNGNEKIPFRERDPLYQTILKREFAEAIAWFIKNLVK